jgi:hypothetical protein
MFVNFDTYFHFPFLLDIATFPITAFLFYAEKTIPLCKFKANTQREGLRKLLTNPDSSGKVIFTVLKAISSVAKETLLIPSVAYAFFHKHRKLEIIVIICSSFDSSTIAVDWFSTKCIIKFACSCLGLHF